MDHDNRRSIEHEGALHDLPWIDRRVVDRALMLDLVRNQDVAAVEEDNTELLDLTVRHGRHQIRDQLVPLIEKRPVGHLLARHAAG